MNKEKTQEYFLEAEEEQPQKHVILSRDHEVVKSRQTQVGSFLGGF